MSAGDVLILLVLALVLFFVFRSLKKQGSKSCTGDCSSCGSTCSKIDWEKIRREIHEDKDVH